MIEDIYYEKLYEGPECCDGLFEFYGALFTEEETEHIRDVLLKYDNDDISGFIKSIQPICRYKYNCVNSKNNSVDIHKNRKNVINTLNDATRILRHMTTPTEHIDPFYINIAHNIIPDCKTGTDSEITWPEWHGDYISIIEKGEILLGNIESYLLEFSNLDDKLSTLYPKGRKHADSDGFYKQIAEAYSIYFGEPNTQKDGEFTNVMRILLDAVGKPIDDPSTGVKQALQKIKC